MEICSFGLIFQVLSCLLSDILGVNGAVINVSASLARGPWFKPRRQHSSCSLRSSDFVPVARRGSFLKTGQAKVGPGFLPDIETNLFICRVPYLQGG